MSFLISFIEELLAEFAGLFTAKKLGWFGRVAGKVASNGAFQKMAAETVSNAFGFVDTSGKTLEEELLMRDLKNFLKKLTPPKKDGLEKFLLELSKDADRGVERLVALNVYLASGIKKGAKQVTETVPPPAGSTEKPKKVSYLQLDFNWAVGLIDDILAFSTYAEKKAYLEIEGVFSTMKKVAQPHPVVEKIKRAIVADVGPANVADLKETSENWLERAKKFRDDARKRR